MSLLFILDFLKFYLWLKQFMFCLLGQPKREKEGANFLCDLFKEILDTLNDAVRLCYKI